MYLPLLACCLSCRRKPVSTYPLSGRLKSGSRLSPGRQRTLLCGKQWPERRWCRGGSIMETRAAVAHKAGQPLSIETVRLDGPQAGEVLVEIKATGICHTDAYTLSGADPEGLFPAILGHEGAGVVVEVGPGVTSLKKGDHLIPLYTPECRQCPSCLSRKTNLCTAIRATQGQGVMPDGTSRFSLGGEMIHHYMGTSTFANFTVLPEIAVAKIRADAPFHHV